MNNLAKNLTSSLPWDVKSAMYKVKNAVLNYTEMESKVREATNVSHTTYPIDVSYRCRTRRGEQAVRCYKRSPKQRRTINTSTRSCR